jgi:hypothetical protein
MKMRSSFGVWKSIFRRSIGVAALLMMLSSTSYSQSFWNWGKAVHLSSTIGCGMSSGFADHNNVLKYSDVDNQIYYDKVYHNFQTAERTLYVAAGLSIPFTSEFKPFRTASDVLLSLTWQGIFHNIGQNLARNKPIFWTSDYQKTNNTSGFEKFSKPEYQIGAFVAVLAINYLVYTLLDE